MRLNGLIFSHLYAEIIQYIIANDLSDEQRKRIAPNSTSIWHEFQFGNRKKKLIWQIYLPTGTDEDYLVKKKSRLRVGTEYEEDVKDEVIVHILEKKMKRESAKSLSKELQLDRIKAAVLMQYFIKENLPNHFSENEKYYHVYDEVNKKVIFKNLNRKRAQQKKEIISYSTIPRERQIVHVATEPRFHDYALDIAKYDFIKFIKQYYQHLKVENYLDAFEMWHPKHQRYSFSGSIANFRNLSNSPLQPVSKISFFRTTVKRPRMINWQQVTDKTLIGATSLIYFEESVSRFEDSPDFDKIKLKDFNKIALWLDKIKKEVENRGLFNFEEMSVRDFLSGHLYEKFARIDRDITYEVVGNVLYTKTYRLFEIAAVYNGKKWILCSIRPIYSHDRFTNLPIDTEHEIDNLCTELYNVEMDFKNGGQVHYFMPVLEALLKKRK